MTRLLAPPLLVALAACGPTQSTAMLGDTEDMLESARRSGAEEKAPYEFHAAQLYLRGSREQIGRGEYDAALQLAARARAMARAAKDRAASGGPGGEAPPVPDGPMPESMTAGSGEAP